MHFRMVRYGTSLKTYQYAFSFYQLLTPLCFLPCVASSVNSIEMLKNFEKEDQKSTNAKFEVGSDYLMNTAAICPATAILVVVAALSTVILVYTIRFFINALDSSSKMKRVIESVSTYPNKRRAKLENIRIYEGALLKYVKSSVPATLDSSLGLNSSKTTGSSNLEQSQKIQKLDTVDLVPDKIVDVVPEDQIPTKSTQ
ncbi:hypothetical protein FQA39_LY17241 [Lamprigera yunnana]|nr:hypothetical protein FQA39_LY17241 [Lamprigera yunnana]